MRPDDYEQLWSELPALLFFPIRGGKFVSVDPTDAPGVTGYRWGYLKGYVVRTIWQGGRNRTIYMHRVITDCPADMEVDHRNGYGLNNHRGNLRVCTHAQNMKNKRSRRHAVGIKDAGDGTFEAWFGQRRLGRFNSFEAAAAARNAAKVRRDGGEFSFLHDVKPGHGGREIVARGKSGFRGVYAHPCGKWQVFCADKHVALCDSAEEGARRYDRAARERFGSRAKLNFPEEVAAT